MPFDDSKTALTFGNHSKVQNRADIDTAPVFPTDYRVYSFQKFRIGYVAPNIGLSLIERRRLN